MKQVKTIKVFLFQAGAFSALPNGDLPFMIRIFRVILGSWVMGLGPNYMDNEAVIKYVDSIQSDIDFKTIVTRPSALDDSEGGATLAVTETPPTSKTAFKDLASFTLQAIKDQLLYGTYPFVG